MIELSREQLPLIKPLFTGYPYLHDLVHGILVGAYGEAFADNLSAPNSGMLCYDGFVLFAGDPSPAAAGEMISSRPPKSALIGPSIAWEELIRQLWPNQFRLKQRVAFESPSHWDRARLQGFIGNIPPGYTLKPITPADASAFGQLSTSLVETDPKTGQFSFARGVGFGISQASQFVAGCSGIPAGGKLEFEVQAHPDHAHRGLATAVAAALIQYCLDHDLEPCWDAAHQVSASLGQKLGFAKPTPYNVYILTQA
jgi:hypothetical protein